MTRRLSDLDPKSNSIGFLRLTAALLVILGHSFPFGGYGEDPLVVWTNNQHAFGRIAVDVFFCLSGFLITWSYIRGRSWGVYLWHRFLRIYPAFWMCLLVTGLVVAPLLGSGPNLGYIINNFLLVTGYRQTRIPGLFEDAPYADVVNGSLWTLPWEVRAYLVVLLLGVTGLLKFRWVALSGLGITWALTIFEIYSQTGTTDNEAVSSGARLFMFFFAGVTFYTFRQRIPVDWRLFVGSLAFMVTVTVAGAIWVPYSGGLFYTLCALPLTYAVFWLAMRLPFTRINTRWDFSYGIYVYGTLLITIFAVLGWNALPWWTFTLICLVAATVAGAASWYLIERPAMSLKNSRIIKVQGQRRFVFDHRRAASLVGSGSAVDR